MLVSTTLHSLVPSTANPATPLRHNNPVLETAYLARSLVCTANPATPCRHNNPVLETAYLARSLVCPAGPTAPETPPPAVAVSRRIGIRRVGSEQSPTTSHPDQQNLRPKSPPSSLPGSWSAVTTKEAGSTNQSSSSLPRSKASASCSRFWRFSRGAAVYAHGLLDCTNYGSIGPTWCSAGLSSF